MAESGLVHFHYLIQIRALTIFYGKVEAQGTRPLLLFTKSIRITIFFS